MTAEQVRYLPEVLEATVAALAPHALALTDAFAVPEEVTAHHPMLRSEGYRRDPLRHVLTRRQTSGAVEHSAAPDSFKPWLI